MTDITNISNEARANILIEALPYIQQYSGKIVVIKYGGNAMLNHELKQAVMTDIVFLSLCGFKIVLVHGGGPEIDAMLTRIGKESKFINGLRQTDEETMEIVQMVLGKLNKDLVQILMKAHRGTNHGTFEGKHKGHAIGFCGLDSCLLEAKQLNEELGFVGDITDVNIEIIKTALHNHYIPVIATFADGGDGVVYNVNADTAASRIASALEAENLILMTDVKGVLKNKNDENTLIHTMKVNEVSDLKKQGIITGGMIPKIDCCVEAVESGVKKANIIDGRIKHSVLLELLTDKGAGTMIVDSRRTAGCNSALSADVE
ncbi:MAG: acetylglutamate kinase [Oscillospiraceae bacterium]|nr:acetylglutamate kinase [Oscillospiraceae bacterium]